jgi:hypothetical protein
VAPDQHNSLFESPEEGREIVFNGSRAVHLWNHLLEGEPGFDKNNRFAKDSPYEQLCTRYLNGDG